MRKRGTGRALATARRATTATRLTDLDDQTLREALEGRTVQWTNTTARTTEEEVIMPSERSFTITNGRNGRRIITFITRTGQCRSVAIDSIISVR